MRSRILVLATALATVVVACGGGGPTQAPGGATQDPGGPVATPGGDNGGDPIGTEHGKVTFTVTGAITTQDEYGFVPEGSLFGGDQGSALNFGASSDGSGAGGLLSIAVNADGTVTVSFTGTAGQVPGATCTTSNWNVGASSGSGTFDCTSELSITASGAVVGGSTIKGDFTAHP